MEAIVDQFYTAIRTGATEQLYNIIHEDFVLTCPTRDHVLSGVYQGKTRFFNDVLPHVFGCVKSTAMVFCADYRVVCRAGDVVVALAQNEGCARGDGPEYNQVYVHIFRVLDGQVRSLVEVFDTALADRALWGDVADLAPDEPFTLAGLAAQGF